MAQGARRGWPWHQGGGQSLDVAAAASAITLSDGGPQAPASEPQPAPVPKAVEMPDPPTTNVNPKRK